MWHSNRYFERKITHAHQHMLNCLSAAANILCASYDSDDVRNREFNSAMRAAGFARDTANQWLDAYAAQHGPAAAA